MALLLLPNSSIEKVKSIAIGISSVATLIEVGFIYLWQIIPIGGIIWYYVQLDILLLAYL